MCDFAKYLALSPESARDLEMEKFRIIGSDNMDDNVRIDQSTDERRPADYEFGLRLHCASLTLCLLLFVHFEGFWSVSTSQESLDWPQYYLFRMG